MKQESKHQEIKHQEIKHQEIKHQEIKHQEIKHQEIKHQEIKHQEIKHQEIKHHNGYPNGRRGIDRREKMNLESKRHRAEHEPAEHEPAEHEPAEQELRDREPTKGTHTTTRSPRELIPAVFLALSTRVSMKISEFREEFIFRVRNLILDERGDVPGWVLVVLMTTGLVTGIWTVAAPRIEGLLRGSLDAMNNVR